MDNPISNRRYRCKDADVIVTSEFLQIEQKLAFNGKLAELQLLIGLLGISARLPLSQRVHEIFFAIIDNNLRRLQNQINGLKCQSSVNFVEGF